MVFEVVFFFFDAFEVFFVVFVFDVLFVVEDFLFFVVFVEVDLEFLKLIPFRPTGLLLIFSYNSLTGLG